MQFDKVNYLKRVIQHIFFNCKSFYWYLLSMLLLKILSPFISVYFSKYMVSYLSNKNYAYRSFLCIVFIFLIAKFLSQIMVEVINSKLTLLTQNLHQSFNKQIMKKYYNSTYEYVVDKGFNEKKAIAVNAYKNNKMTEVLMDLFEIMQCTIVVLGMSYILKQFSSIVWISLISILLIEFITGYYSKKANYQMDQFDTIFNVKTSYLRGVANDFNAAKDIRIFNMHKGIERKMEEYTAQNYQEMKKYYSTFFKRNTLIDISGLLFNLITYIYLGYQLLIQHTITLSEFVFFIGAITSAYSSLQTITNKIILFNSNLIYVKDFYEFLDIPSENKSTAQKMLKVESINTLEVRNLSFRYPGCEEYSLFNVNFKFTLGNAYMIVGENGAGKSTLIKLILRFYDTYSGEILLNGIDIRKINYQEYMNYFTGLFQDFTTLPLSISQNIASNVSEVDREMVVELIKQVGLKEKIDSLEQNIDTSMSRIFDSDGTDFSGGQLQKIAFARSMYKNAMIALFDEPSSALDVYSEEVILRCIEKLAKKKIVLYTTHRLSAKKIASNIIVMSHGRVIEHGTHETLMKKKSEYYHMFKLQASHYVKEV